MPWGVSFLALSIWYFCASYIWMDITFLQFRKFFSMVLLKRWSVPLTWNSSSSMSIKVPGYSFSELKKKKKVSAFEKPDSSGLTSSSDILSSSWLILLVWISSKVFFLLNGWIFYFHFCFNLDFLQSNLFDEFTFHIRNEWGLRTGRRAEPRCLKARGSVSSCLGVLRQVAWEGGAKGTSCQHW